MTHQEYRERLDEILKDYRQALQQQMGLILDSRHRLDIETADKYLIETPMQAIDRLFLDVVGDDEGEKEGTVILPYGEYDVVDSIRSERDILRQQLRTTITGKEGGE